MRHHQSSFAFLAFDPQPAGIALQQILGHGQSQTESLLFVPGAIELPKRSDLPELVTPNAAARILD